MSDRLSAFISETPAGWILEKLDFGYSTRTYPQSPNLIKNRAKISGTSYEEDLRTLYYCGRFEHQAARTAEEVSTLADASHLVTRALPILLLQPLPLQSDSFA